MVVSNSVFKNYQSSLILLTAIAAGCAAGVILKEKAAVLKPFGDIFLNLLFTAVVPLVFFSISSSVAAMSDARRLGRILGSMLLIFVMTGVISSLLMIAVVLQFPPAEGMSLSLGAASELKPMPWQDQLVGTLTVGDFKDLLSKKNMLPLILFSVLLGLSCLMWRKKAQAFTNFLVAGHEVFSGLIGLIMLYAPIGLGCYFAYLLGVHGPELLGSYARAMAVYYPVALFYFVTFFSMYAYMAGGASAVRMFWKNIIPVALTAWGTGSSVASIPVNLEAAKKSKVPQDIRELVIPMGATIHMDGSCLSAVLKIALLFGLYQMDFSGWQTILTAVGIALLSGTVMSGIPGGGFLGELMIVTLYGFPPEALPIISMIGALVDPPATMINSVGDNVAGMLVGRLLGGRAWMEQPQEN